MISSMKLLTLVFWLLATGAFAQDGDGTVVRASMRGVYVHAGDDWRPAVIGGGGYVTGMDFSSDGTQRCFRTDTYGAYCWNGAEWSQVVTSASMPPADFGPGSGEGVYDLRIAQSSPAIMYMGFLGKVYRTADRGVSWTATAFAQVGHDDNDPSMHPNDNKKYTSGKIAVDPDDPNHVLVGTALDGLWRTTNGGTSWTQIVTVPTTGSISAITFGGADEIFLGSIATARGIYRSADNGETFSLISGGPSGVTGSIYHGAYEGGNFYVTSGTNLYRYNGSSWSDCSYDVGSNHQNFALAPDSTNLIVSSESSAMRRSSNNCESGSWEANYYFSISYNCVGDATWLCSTVTLGSVGLNQAQLMYDPTVAGRVWVASGVGPWYTDLGNPPSITFNSKVRGVEEIVANTVIVPPNGRDLPVGAGWDFGVHTFTDPSNFATEWEPGDLFGAAWHVDWASSDPNFIVAHVCWTTPKSRYSADGGQTWTAFPSMPLGSTSCEGTWGFGGTIAAASPTNWVYVSSNGDRPYYTTDGGSTWNTFTLAGVENDATEDGWGGIHFRPAYNRHIVAADRVNVGTFYIYHYNEGVFRSTDGGATWTNRDGPLLMENDTGFNNTIFNAKLLAVPGEAGHLFFTAGQEGSNPATNNPADSQLWRSTDGGDTWTAMPNVKEVYAMGFGKEANGYPTLLIVGWVSDSYGVWRSTDQGTNWERLGGEYALNSFDRVDTIDGEKVGDKVYIGFRGMGWGQYGR